MAVKTQRQVAEERAQASSTAPAAPAPAAAPAPKRKVEVRYIAPNAPEKGVASAAFFSKDGKTVQVSIKDRAVQLPKFVDDGERREFIASLLANGFHEDYEGEEKETISLDGGMTIWFLMMPERPATGRAYSGKYIIDPVGTMEGAAAINVNDGTYRTANADYKDGLVKQGWVIMQETKVSKEALAKAEKAPTETAKKKFLGIFG